VVGTKSLSFIYTTAQLKTDVVGAKAISSGLYHTCAVVGSGAVKCWGYNYTGALGNGKKTAATYVAQSVIGISDAVELASSNYTTCARLKTGQVKCWGNCAGGACANGSTASIAQPTPKVALQLAGVTQLDAGYAHFCATLSSGQVKCWGNGQNYKLGQGSTASSGTPKLVKGLSGALMVSAIYYNSCALLETGKVKCWGRNTYGAMGTGKTGEQSSQGQLFDGASGLSDFSRARISMYSLGLGDFMPSPDKA